MIISLCQFLLIYSVILFNVMFSSNAFSILPSTLFTILIRPQPSVHCIIGTPQHSLHCIISTLQYSLPCIIRTPQHSLHYIISTCFLSCLGTPSEFPLVATISLLAILSGCLVTVNGFPPKRTGQHVQRLQTQPWLVGHQ